MNNRFFNAGKAALRWWKFKRLNLCEVPPNHVFIARFQPGDAVIDVGTGNDPDLSKYLLSHYDVECFGVDPTRKHAPTLQAFAHTHPRFHHLPYALGTERKTVLFHESQANVSGSLLPGHRNIVNDPVIHYEVDMITVEDVVRLAGRPSIALLKLDIEGAEYEVIKCLRREWLTRIRQIMVEFHHQTVQEITWQDTLDAIRTIERLGMKSFVYNGRDCLFYW